jgi:hypothetical protein
MTRAEDAPQGRGYNTMGRVPEGFHGGSVGGRAEEEGYHLRKVHDTL